MCREAVSSVLAVKTSSRLGVLFATFSQALGMCVPCSARSKVAWSSARLASGGECHAARCRPLKKRANGARREGTLYMLGLNGAPETPETMGRLRRRCC
ncbi:hypothetical protein EI94DRAFT_1720911 [Lactarius quietus]|nr:hypothetical protein EI94DRAFT_1720911 [Lactarius quietus]